MSALPPVPLDPAWFHGAVEVVRTDRGLLPLRLPAWAREQVVDPQLAMVVEQAGGVHLRLRTTATVLELDWVPLRRRYDGLATRPDAPYELLVDGEPLGPGLLPDGGEETVVDLARGAVRQHDLGRPATTRWEGLPGREVLLEVWLPHAERTELVAARADAPLRAEPVSGPRWVHHGSSISQGSNAAAPTGTWPVLAARRTGAALTNLGFGGGAMLDQVTARTMRDLPADVLSVEIGINLVNADAMRLRAFVPAVHGFLDTLRDGHPDVPLLLVSPFHCPIHEDTPGPGAFDPDALARGVVRFRADGRPEDVATGRLTLAVVRDWLSRIVETRAAHDPALRLVDGTTLYGPADHDELPLEDGLHPGPEAHARIGTRFADGPLAAALR